MAAAWERVRIAGKDADVFAPARPRFGLLFLHDRDGRTLAEDSPLTALLAQHHLACVCPHGGLSWWGDRSYPDFDPTIKAERFLLDRVLPYFEESWRLAPKAVGLLGLGMGGQGALRLAFKHPQVFSTVAAITPILDYHELYGRGTELDAMYDSKEQCRQDTALLHVPPYHPPPHIYFAIDPADPWYRGSDRLHEKLNALGVPHTFELAPGGGESSWSYLVRTAGRAVEFLTQGLDEESRRLL